MMVRTPIQEIKRKLQDLEYRKLFGAAEAKDEFAVTLARVRNDLNMTQKELADMFGVKQPYIAKLEGGDANPTLGAIGGLLAVMNLRLAMNTKPLLHDVAILPSQNTIGQGSTVADAGMSWLDSDFLYPASGICNSTAQVTLARHPYADTKCKDYALV